jgi:preprotein translocase subunit SecA
MDSEGEQRIKDDPYAFMQNMPDLIEASMGLRIWIGMIQAVERRLGDSLGLEPKLIRSVDWDQAESELYEAIEKVWENRSAGILKDIRTDLNNALRGEDKVDYATKVRLLVQMSYGQRSYFDKKTHQRQAVMVARLSYPFYAAEILDSSDPGELAQDIFEHLKGSQETLEEALGQSEFANLSGTRLEQVDQPVQDLLREALGSAEYEKLLDGGTLTTFHETAKDKIMQALGNRALTRAYRELFLSVADRLWVDYLTQMEALRTSIGLEAYGQRDPLVQYKSRAFDLFSNLLVVIRAGMVSRMFRLRVAGGRQTASTPATPAQAQPAAAGGKSRKRRRRRRR